MVRRTDFPGGKMLVQNRMTKNPETISPDEFLASGLVKMRKGGFRRLPVVQDAKLIGTITDRDLREHAGLLERTKISSGNDQRFADGHPSRDFRTGRETNALSRSVPNAAYGNTSN
jgi:CBS-domain-containing membrane protein